MAGRHAEVQHGSPLTESELRLLPLLVSQLSLREIAQRLELPRGVVLAMAQEIYAKLGPVGESRRASAAR